MAEKRSDLGNIPNLWRWEGQTGYPRRFISAVENILEDSGFRVHSDYREDDASLRDSAYYGGSIRGIKEISYLSWVTLAIGVLLLPLIVGFWVARAAFKKERAVLDISFNGELYWATARAQTSRADMVGSEPSIERSGVLADLRITIKAGAGSPEGQYQVNSITKRDRWGLESQARSIVEKLEEQLPTLQVPTSVTG